MERAADVSSPQRYEKEGLRFSYPENWRVTEDAESDELRYLIVETPGDAIVLVQVYRAEDAVEIDEYVEWFAGQAGENISIGSIGDSETESLTKTVAGEERTGVKERFSIEILGTSVPHQREYFRIERGDRVIFLIAQAATEDWEKVAPGFDLVFGSFEPR